MIDCLRLWFIQGKHCQNGGVCGDGGVVVVVVTEMTNDCAFKKSRDRESRSL
jgi:hypothetical protein